ncbi:hypothetical protein [Virgibacillus dokdonensis]|uniref:hypothetical protein n=1 Tax=Virgibacillus dokdonensis TaxID=302167 RepID=UPI0015F25B02|nr:hypothetical protein [Virgibacillus dokdonensis]
MYFILRLQTNKDLFFNFIESWLISLILLFFISYSLASYFFDYSEVYQRFLETSMSLALHNLKSSLLSIAAIFIGIYVTVFTLLGSIKVDSIFAYLNEYTFKKLIKFIRNAFIAAFGYLVLIMILEIIYTDYNEIPFWLILLNASIVIYMFLTAFRFGVILYISFSKDLGDIQENILKHREEKRKLKELQYRLENFLADFEKKEEEKRNNQISEIINKGRNDSS